MNTIRVISSISFNSPSFFEATIRRMVDCKGQIIDWAHWIVHRPDTDQRKEHIHFVLKPSRRVDTNWLRQQFIETPDAHIAAKCARGEALTEDDLKPLGVMPFRQTVNMADWLLYSVHHVGYLFRKGQSRNEQYSFDDIKSTSHELLHEQWLESQDPLESITQRVIELYTVQQMSYGEILKTCIVPPNLVYYFKTMLENLDDSTVKRKRKWKEDLTI